MRKLSSIFKDRKNPEPQEEGSTSGKVINLERARRAREEQKDHRPDRDFWNSLNSGKDKTQNSGPKSMPAASKPAQSESVITAASDHEETKPDVAAASDPAEVKSTVSDTSDPTEIKSDVTAASDPTEVKSDVTAASDPTEVKSTVSDTSDTKEAESAASAASDSSENEEDWRDTLAYLETEEKQAEAERAEKRSGGKGGRGGGRSILSIVLGLAALLIVAGGIFYVYQRFAPSKKQMDPKEYFEWMIAREKGIEAEEQVLAEDELAVLFENQVLSETALMSDEKLYLSYDLVLDNIFTRFYWDTSLENMLFTTADDTWRIPLNSASYTTKDGPESYEVPIFITREEKKYICADFLQQYANMTYEVWPEEYHVQVTASWGERLSASAKRNAAVRFGSDTKRDIVTQVQKGDAVYVLDQTEKWTRVLTPDGYIGWMQNSMLTDPETITTSHEYTPADYAENVRDQKINLVWHQIGSTDGNKFFTSDTAGISGVNVISPTWFSLTDNAGNFSSYAEKSYVRKAHNKDMEVWGLVDNFSANMSTAALTADAAAREALISNLINAALEVEMDGINIDFETISEEAGHSYVQFIRELSVACRANNLVLSVDVPVPTIYSTQYNRSELGVFCDYVIMMGYDEHYSGSEAGSVASLSFEENGITDSLTELPAKKLISAVPFYTRLWYTLGDSTWSEAYGMNTIATTIDTYNVETVWNDETKQNYAEWTLDDGTLCRIWVEDEESLALKADLVKNYELGGIAAWALGFERSSVWSVLSEHIGS